MNRKKSRSWAGEKSTVYCVSVSIREYHMRLEQMMNAIYAELSQLRHDPKNSSSSFPKLIYASPNEDQTNQGLDLNEQLREVPQEDFDGVA